MDEHILTLVYLAAVLAIIYFVAKVVARFVGGIFDSSVPLFKQLSIAAVIVAVIAYWYNPTATVAFLGDLWEMLADIFRRQAASHEPFFN
jgi:hypothetical protein